MSISEILNDKESSSKEKLEKIATIVATARTNYGNVDATIPSGSANTAYGSVAFEHLEDDSKIELVKREVAMIRVAAVEADTETTGVNINKEIEKLIAVSPLLNNLVSKTKLSYL